jgi:alpha-1,2-mannosyltransferase
VRTFSALHLVSVCLVIGSTGGLWLLDRWRPLRYYRHLAFGVVALSAVLETSRLWWVRHLNRVDFHIYYGAVKAAGHQSLYDYKHAYRDLGFTYPSFAAFVVRPFTLLPETMAEHAWLIVGVIAAVAALIPLAARLPWRHRDPWGSAALLTALFIWCGPIFLTLRIGQINTIVALLITIDVLLLARNSAFTGVGVGVATAVKLVPGVGLLLYVVAKRWNAVLMAIGAGAVATLCALLAWPTDTVRFFTTELWATDRVGRLDSNLNNSVRRVIEWLPLGDSLKSLLWLIVVVVVVVVALGRMRRSVQAGHAWVGMLIAMCVSYVVSPITWSHHQVLLLPAAALWGMHCWRVAGQRAAAGARWAQPAAFVVIGVMVWAMWDPAGGGQGWWTSIPRLIFSALFVFTLPVSAAELDRPPTSDRADREIHEDAVPTADPALA